MLHTQESAITIIGEPTPARVDKSVADIFAEANMGQQGGLDWLSDVDGEYQRLSGQVLDTESDSVAARMVIKKYKPVAGNSLVGKITIRPIHSGRFARYNLLFNEQQGNYELSMNEVDISHAIGRRAAGRKYSPVTKRKVDEDTIQLVINYLEHFKHDSSTD